MKINTHKNSHLQTIVLPSHIERNFGYIEFRYQISNFNVVLIFFQKEYKNFLPDNQPSIKIKRDFSTIFSSPTSVLKPFYIMRRNEKTSKLLVKRHSWNNAAKNCHPFQLVLLDTVKPPFTVPLRGRQNGTESRGGQQIELQFALLYT